MGVLHVSTPRWKNLSRREWFNNVRLELQLLPVQSNGLINEGAFSH